MTREEELRELWRSLALVEDLLSGGVAMPRPEPDFGAMAAAGAASAAAMPLPEVASSPAPAPVFPAASALVPAPQPRAASLAELRDRALACTACGLSATRHSVVFGQGVPDPVVLVVGEGPGAEEDRQGLPFVGASGQLLDRMLASIGLSRETNCYIANIVKCRPPGNRDPESGERDACIPFLRSQIDLLRPRAILCAGRVAAQSLLGTAEGINRLRTRDLALGGLPVVATYHPSALLRDESLKRPAWEDLKRLRGILQNG